MGKSDKAAVNSPKEEEKKTEGNGVPTMPGDFQLVTPLEGEQLWYKPEASSVVHGRLLGRFPRKDDSDGAYYQIRVEKFEGKNTNVKAIKGSGDDAKVIDVQPGQVINMDERSSIANLAAYADSDGIFNVFIHCLEKIKIKGNRTFWRMSAGAKAIKNPSVPISQTKQSKRQDDMGTPF